MYNDGFHASSTYDISYLHTHTHTHKKTPKRLHHETYMCSVYMYMGVYFFFFHTFIRYIHILSKYMCSVFIFFYLKTWLALLLTATYHVPDAPGCQRNLPIKRIWKVTVAKKIKVVIFLPKNEVVKMRNLMFNYV